MRGKAGKCGAPGEEGKFLRGEAREDKDIWEINII